MIDGATLRRHRTAGVLLDTNLLLLYVIGAHDRDLIQRFKRTAKFTPEDFRILTDALDTGTIGILTELQVPAREASAEDAFPRFGLTDVAILRNARDKCLVLTEDFRLSQYLAHERVEVLNFNNLRTYLLD